MKLFALFFVVLVALVAACAGLKNGICGLPHSKDGNGNIACAAFIPSWSYNAGANACVSFVYGGCGGNANRFESQQTCERMCKE